MRRSLLSVLCCLSIPFLQAQSFQSKKSGQVSNLQKVGIGSSTDSKLFQKTNWQFSIQSIFDEEENYPGNAKALKAKKNAEKRNQHFANLSTQAQNKTLGASPSVGQAFKGNELRTWTPADNSIAISNGGIIISTTNYSFNVYDTLGTAITQNVTWQTFMDDTTLKSMIFDPRVIYDKLHDRFILVVLHGTSPSTSRLLTCFSKSNNPIDGWRIYKLSGNPFNNTAWTDFPTIGINDDELFINGNQFGPASQNFSWKGSYIYQIGLAEGYQGDSLEFVTWNQIAAPDGAEPITMYPASDGFGNSIKEKMHFVHLPYDTSSHVYVYRIDGKLDNPNKTLTASQYAIPYYEICADGYERVAPSGGIDSISTGGSWTQNAFIVKNTIHFTHAAEINGWCGVHYGRINLDSNKATVIQNGIVGSDLAYPVAAAFGYDSTDQTALLAYVRSDSTIYPEVGIFMVDSAMNTTPLQLIRVGDTTVNVLFTPNYAAQPERWGDYSGISRKMNASKPEAWLAASYGANNTRKACYNTWIAQVITNEPAPVSEPVSNENFNTKSITKIYPNPASDLFTLEFKNEKTGKVRIDIKDMNGRSVKLLFEDVLRESQNKISFNQLMLANGVYILQIQRDGKLISNQKISIQH